MTMVALLALAILASLGSLVQANNKRKQTRCEKRGSRKVEITYCNKPGYFIEVRDAMYGYEAGNDVCEKDYDITCKAPLALEVVKNECDGRRTCAIDVKNDNFGNDPCKGKEKYLRVHYTCVKKTPWKPTRTAKACEKHGIQYLSIDCGVENVIDIISAKYGSDNGISRVCLKSGDGHGNACSKNVDPTVTDECEGFQKCKVHAHDDSFNSACPYKRYLQATWDCVPKTQIKRVVACEHEDLDIDCGDGKVIKIDWAKYGRPGKRYNREDTRCKYVYRTTDESCWSYSSVHRVREACQDQQQCTVRAENDTFGNDPCYDAKKELQVTYRCESG